MYRAYAVSCDTGAASLTLMIILYLFLHSVLQIHEIHIFIISILTMVAFWSSVLAINLIREVTTVTTIILLVSFWQKI